MSLTIRPLTKDLWPEFETLFGANGACAGCWCMWWRLRRSEFQDGAGARNRAQFKRRVEKGSPPGLLAFEGDKVVGWCQLTPRSELPTLDRSRLLKAVDDRPVWSLSCFFIRPGHRGRRIMSALIDAAVEHAKEAEAPALEAYPWDSKERKPNSTVYTGLASAFATRGFRVVARRAMHRPIMRHEFSPSKARARER